MTEVTEGGATSSSRAESARDSRKIPRAGAPRRVAPGYVVARGLVTTWKLQGQAQRLAVHQLRKLCSSLVERFAHQIAALEVQHIEGVEHDHVIGR